jgi:acetamidase/formamidase
MDGSAGESADRAVRLLNEARRRASLVVPAMHISAYAICSVAVDLKISQVVDVPNMLVSAFLPEDIFIDS